LSRKTGEKIEEEQARGPFTSLEDLARRIQARKGELDLLAHTGALSGLGLRRRAALWQVSALARPAGPLFDRQPDPPHRTREPSPLSEMTPFEETAADYGGTGMSTGPHPVSYLRSRLRKEGVIPAMELPEIPNGKRIKVAGAVTVRQRPGTAKGLLFMTMEDETGIFQAVVFPDQLQENREIIAGSPGLVIDGILQKKDGTLSVRGESFRPLPPFTSVKSRDFR
jgi:error-prone DNA polymerase